MLADRLLRLESKETFRRSVLITRGGTIAHPSVIGIDDQTLRKGQRYGTLVCGLGAPLRMFLTAGQRSDCIGARALLDSLPPAKHMLADRGYDADWYREELENRGVTLCIPSRKGRKTPIPHDETRYRLRHKIENSFARLKDWRRIATRYDRCPKVFLSARALAAVVIFWS